MSPPRRPEGAQPGRSPNDKAPQNQLDTRALEVSAKALAISELSADAIGQLRSEMRQEFQHLSDRNDSQHGENKTAMESGFAALHARISAEKDARHQLELSHARDVPALEKWIWRTAAVFGCGLAVYLLVNDTPFVRRDETPAVNIQQGINQ